MEYISWLIIINYYQRRLSIFSLAHSPNCEAKKDEWGAFEEQEVLLISRLSTTGLPWGTDAVATRVTTYLQERGGAVGGSSVGVGVAGGVGVSLADASSPRDPTGIST